MRGEDDALLASNILGLAVLVSVAIGDLCRVQSQTRPCN